jgi:hypothetical protein
LGSLEERLLAGARLLYEKTGAIISVTSTNLAAVVEPYWKPTTSLNRVEYCTKKLVDERKKLLDPRLAQRFEITDIQLLREIAGLSRQSEIVIKTAEKWGSFSYGKTDWLREIAIPIEIGYKEALLLGILWGDAWLDDYPTYLLSGGRSDDFLFYNDVVKGLFEDVHNLHTEVYVSNGTPVIPVSSAGMVTWLIDDLGFPDTIRKGDVKLPRIEWTEESEGGFFDGIVASMSIVYKSGMKINDKDDSFRHEIKKLSERLGFTPVERHYYLYYSPSEVRNMSLVNPRHAKR